MDTQIRTTLDAALAASAQVDVSLLDAPTHPSSTETLRQDIETLTKPGPKAPMKVSIAAIVGKLVVPEWDTRKHQVDLGGLHSLRVIDHVSVANHLHALRLYETNTEGTLTRSFELNHPYTMDYPGRISPALKKKAFLRVINRLNDDYSQALADTMLRYFLGHLADQRDLVVRLQTQAVVLGDRVSLRTVKDILTDIFTLGAGVSVTPAIVVHTAFGILQPTLWPDITLAPLKQHTAADVGRAIGDVEAYRGTAPFLSVEIKHQLAITEGMIRTFSQKTGGVPVRFMLTTKATPTTYRDDTILIGNVTDVILQYLHAVPSIASRFLTTLREALMANPNLAASNKEAIDAIFTRHAAAAAPAAPLPPL